MMLFCLTLPSLIHSTFEKLEAPSPRRSKHGGSPAASSAHTPLQAQAPTPPSPSSLLLPAKHIHPLHRHCQGTALPPQRHPLWTLLKQDSHWRELHLETSPEKNLVGSSSNRPVLLQHREQLIMLRAQQSMFPWKQAAFLCLLTALDSGVFFPPV